jgi:transposase
MSGDSTSWEGWSHVRWFVEEVPAGALRERAVRMVAEISEQHESEWAAISEVARLLGVGCAETVRKWVRQAQVDGGARPGITTEESAELER